jgi:tetratricopeptide (TPR) repeat protein
MGFGRAAFVYSILCLLAAGAAQAARSPAARALELLRTGHSKEAVEVLQAQLARDPRSAQLATDLGYALARLGRDAEAEAAFQRAIELDPRRWYAYANLASLRTSRRAGGLPPAERDELVLLLERGLSWQGKPGGDPAAKALAKGGLLVALADVERAAGNATAARARLSEARPLPLTTALERRAQAVEQALQGEAQAGRSAEEEAWPEPAVAPGEQSALEAAGARLPADAAGALQDAERLSLAHPSWRGARWLQARALLALGRLDDAARALSALLRLDPAHAAAWRALGETLAEHGGQFESERADEALRHALALEPGWSELWLVRGRLLLRRGRPAEALRALERLSAEVKARGAKGPAELEALLAAARAQAQGAAQGAEGPRAPPEPTAEARALLREAQEAAARGELGPALEKASQACALSPALVEAAALRWSLGGPAPDEAARLFWDDPPGLSRLIDAVRAAGVQQALRAAEAPAEPPLDPSRPGEPPRPPPPEVLPDGGVAIAPPPLPDAAAQAALVRPWIERAASLGEPSALLFRARLRADAQDRAGALEDLGALVALGGPLPLLEEARAMRALLPVQGGPEAPAADPQAAHLRALLAAGKSAEALAGAQGCEGPEAPQEPARLLALGVAHDFAGELAEALACYRASLRRAPGEPVALARLSRAAARAPLAALEPLSADLALAARAGWPAAFLAQARVLEGAGQTAAALAAVQQFFAQPPREGAAPAGLLPPGVDEPGTADARALRQRLLVAQAAAGEARRNRALGLAALGLCALGAAFLLWLRGLTVAAALRRDPALFPAVARAVAELRHDALKHRASALAMLDEAPRADVAAALLGSRPASLLVEDAWHSLRTAAEGRGLSLRPLSREPVFGPLLRDLRRAEQQLARPAGPRDARVRAVAGRLKEHGERLSALLKLGPRTRLDAALVSGWIRAVEAELRSRALPWASVSLELQGLDLDFPVAAAPLQAVLTNLLRNAQAAAAQGQEPRVLVRVAEERDAAGRRVLRLDVGDSSAQPLSLEQIESRESGRGLSLVRDAVRDWQGHLALRAESPPFHKSVSACFPVPRP